MTGLIQDIRYAIRILVTASWPTVIHAQVTLTGKWQRETKSGTQIVLDLKAAKAALTGTLTYNGQRSTNSDGKVSKNRFTFRATLEGQMEGFRGELAEGQIKFWPDRMGPERATVLKRVKK